MLNGLVLLCRALEWGRRVLLAWRLESQKGVLRRQASLAQLQQVSTLESQNILS